MTIFPFSLYFQWSCNTNKNCFLLLINKTQKAWREHFCLSWWYIFKTKKKSQIMYEIISNYYSTILNKWNIKWIMRFSIHFRPIRKFEWNVLFSIYFIFRHAECWSAIDSSLYSSEFNILFEKITCENYDPYVLFHRKISD